MVDEWGRMVTVGRIVRPQGNRGEVVVASETDFGAERFAPGAVLTTWRDDRLQTLVVVTSRSMGERWVVGFEGVGSIDDAEGWRGAELRVPERDRHPLDAGRYYTHDLVGCIVVREDGSRVGTVARVDLGAGPPTLCVDGEQGEVLLPFVETICRRVDVAGRSIVIDPPEGLLELNQAGRSGDGRGAT